MKDAYDTVRELKGALSRSLQATADQERHLRIAKRPVMEKLEKWLEGLSVDAVQVDAAPSGCRISIWTMTDAEAAAVLQRIMDHDDLRRPHRLPPNGYEFTRDFKRGRLRGTIVFRVLWYGSLTSAPEGQQGSSWGPRSPAHNIKGE